MDVNHSGLKHYREVKARGRQIAMAKAEIRKMDPRLNQSQVDAIYEAKGREQETKSIKIQNRHGQMHTVFVQKI